MLIGLYGYTYIGLVVRLSGVIWGYLGLVVALATNNHECWHRLGRQFIARSCCDMVKDSDRRSDHVLLERA